MEIFPSMLHGRGMIRKILYFLLRRINFPKKSKKQQKICTQRKEKENDEGIIFGEKCPEKLVEKRKLEGCMYNK